jgi:hypothetical protein
MRFALVLVVLAAAGCGAGNNSQPTMFFGTSVSSPALTVLSPNSAPVDSPAFTLTVNGSNFGTDATVFWNGAPLKTILITSNQLMAQLTDADMQFAGMVPVFVRTGGQNSNTVTFNVSFQGSSASSMGNQD